LRGAGGGVGVVCDAGEGADDACGKSRGVRAMRGMATVSKVPATEEG
jgi:hypothetical protein